MKANKFYLTGADDDDIIQEGMIGLYKSIQSFDLEKTIHLEHLRIFVLKDNL